MKRVGLFAAILLFAVTARAASIHVAAAASLNDVLQEIGTRYQKETGDALVFNFGSSSILARQIMEGAPVDVFISADELKMDQLQQRGFIVRRSRRGLLSNSLVIIVPAGSALVIRSPADLADRSVRKIALAEPRSVPAGIYAKQYLRKLKLWDRLTSKIIPTENVRAALAAVESGNAETGIVYKTDAMISRSVRVAYAIPPGQGPKISYPAAIIADSRDKAAAARFLDYLQRDDARRILQRAGFILP